MIHLKNITVVKEGKGLFEDLNFQVLPGENWVIQGENGSGKTLLLKLLAGALTPSSGDVRHSFIQGDDWDTLYRERQEKIHFIPTHWIHAFLAGFDGLFYQQRYYTMDDTRLPCVRDVFEGNEGALERFRFSSNFDINALLDLPITRLSNGQLKKVIILRQVARNVPRLLLLDYPFDGLDAASRRDLSDFLDELATQLGIQLILVDHGPQLPAVISRRLVLSDFKIVQTENVLRPAIPAPAIGLKENAPAQGSDEAVVEMRNLTIAYGSKKIISNLNWRINKGERWALTGRNGSGKTTLFSLIFADHPMAYSQQVFLFGKRRGSGESIWDIKNRISYFGPEQTHFLSAKTLLLSGREYIQSQKHDNGGRLEELAAFFGADKYIDVPIRLLSSGQLQMVLLMNLFLDDKELLLLDEPFQFLDPHNHEKVTRYLTEYLARDITLVLITHDEKDVEKWTELRKMI